MAYQLQVDGMAEISEMLDKMAEAAPAAASRALYEGAGMMADELRKGAESIRTEPFKYAPPGDTRLPSPEEKDAVVQAAIGIAKFGKHGTEVDTSVGFRNSGYVEIAGKKRPIPAIANSINSGTSFMKKQPFFRKAARSGAPKAMEKMRESIDDTYAKFLEEMNRL